MRLGTWPGSPMPSGPCSGPPYPEGEVPRVPRWRVGSGRQEDSLERTAALEIPSTPGGNLQEWGCQRLGPPKGAGWQKGELLHAPALWGGEAGPLGTKAATVSHRLEEEETLGPVGARTPVSASGNVFFFSPPLPTRHIPSPRIPLPTTTRPTPKHEHGGREEEGKKKPHPQAEEISIQSILSHI